MIRKLLVGLVVSAVSLGAGLIIVLLQGDLNYHIPLVGLALAWLVWVNRRLLPF